VAGVAFTVKKNGFPDAPAKLRTAIGRALASVGGTILADEQRRTPVSTGALQGSETVTPSSDGLAMTFKAGTGLSDAHALYVHQGTRHMGARPFLRLAVEAGASQVGPAIASAAQSELA
jgi:HK97 gp10 family phage protein